MLKPNQWMPINTIMGKKSGQHSKLVMKWAWAMELSIVFSTYVFFRVNIDLVLSSVWESKAGSMNFPTRVTCIMEITVDIGTEIDR